MVGGACIDRQGLRAISGIPDCLIITNDSKATPWDSCRVRKCCQVIIGRDYRPSVDRHTVGVLRPIVSWVAEE